MAPPTNRPPTTERVIRLEVVLDAVKEDLTELKTQVQEMDTAIHGLEQSQAVQSSQLAQLITSAAKLQQSANTISGHVLDKALTDAEQFLTATRVKKLIAVGIAIFTIVWGIYQGALQLAKPSQSLLDREGHTHQVTQQK